jgi:hypothetical protein
MEWLATDDAAIRQRCLEYIQFWLDSITVYTYDEQEGDLECEGRCRCGAAFSQVGRIDWGKVETLWGKDGGEPKAASPSELTSPG